MSARFVVGLGVAVTAIGTGAVVKLAADRPAFRASVERSAPFLAPLIKLVEKPAPPPAPHAPPAPKTIVRSHLPSHGGDGCAGGRAAQSRPGTRCACGSVHHRGRPCGCRSVVTANINRSVDGER